MKAAALASLILACVLTPVANDPCLAPICVVNKLCAPTLPPCIRFSKETGAYRWMKITDNRISGQTDQAAKLNLRRVLADGSCQMTITFVGADEAKSLGDCDYERSNASLKAFSVIGKVYRVYSAEDLRQMMNDVPRYFPLSAGSISTGLSTIKATSTTGAVDETRKTLEDATPSTPTLNAKSVSSTELAAIETTSYTRAVGGSRSSPEDAPPSTLTVDAKILSSTEIATIEVSSTARAVAGMKSPTSYGTPSTPTVDAKILSSTERTTIGAFFTTRAVEWSKSSPEVATPSTPTVDVEILSSIKLTTIEASSTERAVGEIKSSLGDATPSTQTVDPRILNSTPLIAATPPSTITSARKISFTVRTTTPASAKTKATKHSTSKTKTDAKFLDDDSQEEPSTVYLVAGIRAGGIFEFQLIGPDDATFKILETLPGTRVVVEGRLVMGFTIFNDQPPNYGFEVWSSNNMLFIFDLHPVDQAEQSAAKERSDHRFVTESRAPVLDLKEAVHHLRKVAGQGTVMILDANSTHIIWIIQKNLPEPLRTSMDSPEATTKGMNGANVMTRFEPCYTTAYRVTMRIAIAILIMLVFSVGLTVWYFGAERIRGNMCSCSKLLRDSPW